MGRSIVLRGARLGAAVLGPLLEASRVLAESADDIRDIRGPRPVAAPWIIWAAIAGVLAAALLGYAAWRRIKRRRAAAPVRADFEVALERLEAARALMAAGRARDFSIEVSGIVREFIEKRFAVRAAHRTTHEFLHDSLGSADPDLVRHRQLLGEFLQSCDLAKFGGWSLSPQQMADMLEGAGRFVRSAAAPTALPEPAAGTGASQSDGSKAHVSLPSA